MKKLLFSLLLISVALLAHGQKESIASLLEEKLPNAQIKRLQAKDHFAEAYEIMIPQQIDHNDPKAGIFMQRLFLYHTNRKAPMVYVTEGYAARDRTYELARMMKANQLTVEYRFFGQSVPDSIQWTYLTNDQAIEDLHYIRKLFKKIYRKKWLATGISKGGTTTLIYKSKYPKDVRVAVPYVAPLAIGQEDERTNVHIKNTGSVSCREKLFAFQRMALERKAELIPMIEGLAKANKETYSLDFETVLEYAVLEFTFSFWQWGGKCEEVPGKEATAEAIFNYLNKVVSYNFYSDATYDYYKPAFYQFMTELGYYGFVTEHLEDLLTKKHYSNRRFAPLNADLAYEPYLKEVVDYLDKKGKCILFIYGANDPWTACGYQPKADSKMMRMDLEGGSHFTRIGSFSKEEQGKIRLQLEKWMKTQVKLP